MNQYVQRSNKTIDILSDGQHDMNLQGASGEHEKKIQPDAQKSTEQVSTSVSTTSSLSSGHRLTQNVLESAWVVRNQTLLMMIITVQSVDIEDKQCLSQKVKHQQLLINYLHGSPFN